MMKKEEEILNELTPDDVGYELLDKTIIAFEGFTDECWANMQHKNRTVGEVEKEILEEWKTKFKSKFREVGWWTDNIFFGIIDKEVESNNFNEERRKNNMAMMKRLFTRIQEKYPERAKEILTNIEAWIYDERVKLLPEAEEVIDELNNEVGNA